MRRHARITVLTAALLLATGCSAATEDPAPPEPAPTSTSAAAEPDTPSTSPSSVGLLAEWQPRLDALPGTKATTTCENPHQPYCTSLLQEINDELTELSDALDTAGGADKYPDTTTEIAEVADALSAYLAGGCRDGSGTLTEADCYAEALIVSTGPAKIDLSYMEIGRASCRERV